MDEPNFSVIMPAHNTSPWIGEAIASVLAQTRPDFELLVIDDGSTDDTAGVVRRLTSDPRVRLLQMPARSGAGAARNVAFARARAPYVCMLDSDDLWLPAYLETVGLALEQNPSAGIACSGMWILDEPPGLIRRGRWGKWNPPGELLDADSFLPSLARGNFILNSTVTIRRSLLVALGGCNAELSAAVDFDLWLRVAAAGYGAVCIPSRLAVYRIRRGSIQYDPRNEARVYRSTCTVYRALAEDWDVGPEVKMIARNQLDLVERHLAILNGQRRIARALLFVRRRVSPLKRLLLRRLLWYATSPVDLPMLGRPTAPIVDQSEP